MNLEFARRVKLKSRRAKKKTSIDIFFIRNPVGATIIASDTIITISIVEICPSVRWSP